MTTVQVTSSCACISVKELNGEKVRDAVTAHDQGGVCSKSSFCDRFLYSFCQPVFKYFTEFLFTKYFLIRLCFHSWMTFFVHES